jgi:ABC-type Mn2+/Zn2+ transport system permease subunit
MNTVVHKTLRFIGQAMQVTGLLVLPLAIAMQLTNSLQRALQVSQMVFMAIFGVCMFLIGMILTNVGRE